MPTLKKSSALNSLHWAKHCLQSLPIADALRIQSDWLDKISGDLPPEHQNTAQKLAGIGNYIDLIDQLTDFVNSLPQTMDS